MTKLDEDDKLLLKRYNLFRLMVGTEGWKELERIKDAQIAIRKELLTVSCTSLDSCLVHEGVKGAMIGIALPFDTVRTILEQGQILVNREEDE